MNAAHKDLLLAQRLQSALIHQGLTVVTARKASVEMVTHALVSNFMLAAGSIIENWIMVYCNSRVLIGLSTVGYQSLYHAQEIVTVG